MTTVYRIEKFNMDTGRKDHTATYYVLCTEKAYGDIAELRRARKPGDPVIHVATKCVNREETP